MYSQVTKSYVMPVTWALSYMGIIYTHFVRFLTDKKFTKC